MSASEIAAFFTAVTGAMVAIFTFWNTHQANQIKSLADANAAHVAERQTDLEERKAYQETIAFWKGENDKSLDIIKAQRDEGLKANEAHAVLRTQHDETRRQLDIAVKDYRDLNTRFEKRVTELDQLKADMSKQGQSLAIATTTIATLTAARDTDHRLFEDTISRANDEHTRERESLQRQISDLQEQVRVQSVKIKQLQDTLREFGDANTDLANRLQKKQDEYDLLLAENKRLVAELARLGKFVGPYDYAGFGSSERPDPTDPPDHAVPVPTEPPSVVVGVIVPDSGDERKVS